MLLLKRDVIADRDVNDWHSPSVTGLTDLKGANEE